jgi:hypothetical protein
MKVRPFTMHEYDPSSMRANKLSQLRRRFPRRPRDFMYPLRKLHSDPSKTPAPANNMVGVSTEALVGSQGWKFDEFSQTSLGGNLT